MAHIYYSTQRPITPGSYPRERVAIDLMNFDSRTFVEEIGREAWGWIEFLQELTDKEAENYELVPVGRKERR